MTKSVYSPAKYGARIWPNSFSLAGERVPTKIGTISTGWLAKMSPINGNYISKLCSFSSAFLEMWENLPVSCSSLQIVWSTLRFPNGVSYSVHLESPHLLVKAREWAGPMMKILFTRSGCWMLMKAWAAVSPENSRPAWGTISPFTI